MANDALARWPRNERRLLLDAEARARKNGNWGQWETLHFPRGSAGNGWSGEFTTVHKNRVFAVLDRDAGTARHLMISSLSGERPSWWEAQRIKNEIAGEIATAVEVYPPASEVVDDADTYHLWVLSAPLPFGLATPARPDREVTP